MRSRNVRSREEFNAKSSVYERRKWGRRRLRERLITREQVY